MRTNTYPAEWDSFLQTFEAGIEAKTSAEIEDLLLQIQQFIRSQLPDSPEYDHKLRTATDAIFQASLVLLEGSEPNHLRQASQGIYTAIKALIA